MGPEGGFITGCDVLMDVARFVAIAIVVLGRWHPIFDALTASDRPYKAAVGPGKAIDILQSEAEAGRLDSELIRIMVESQVYRRVVEKDWRQF
jgi:response regulator RpfG family c-di-GMP phosphodiesterase